MGTQILITLPDEVYERAQQVAQHTSQDVTIMLADTIQRSIPSTKRPHGLQILDLRRGEITRTTARVSIDGIENITSWCNG